MNIALIAAGGSGKRMNSKTNKLLLPVFGKPVLYYTITAFYDHPKVDYIVVIAGKYTKLAMKDLIKKYFPGNKMSKKIRVVAGGNERADSVLNGFNYAKRNFKTSKKDVVLIHNGANPLVTFKEITKLIQKTKSKGACIVAHKVTDTLKEIQKTHILQTHNRDHFMRAQTPQCFTHDVFTDALKKVGSKYATMTDEAMLAEKAGYKVEILLASENNFKITTHKDYEHLKHIMGDVPNDYLVGLGQDSHRFSKEKGLTLAGVKFPKKYKLDGNSDADVILHALCNALMQAIAGKSLGSFSDDMCLNKGIKDSKKYVEKVLEKIKRKGLKVNNIGLMLECKVPKIDPISVKMKVSLAEILDLPVHRIGITATSGEDLTSFGKGEGIQCFCIISLKKISK